MGNETHQIDNSRYIEDQKKQNPLLNVDIDYKKLSTNENPMFEVYKKLAIYSNVDLRSLNQDLKFFKKLKDIIIKAGFILDGLLDKLNDILCFFRLMLIA